MYIYIYIYLYLYLYLCVCVCVLSLRAPSPPFNIFGLRVNMSVFVCESPPLPPPRISALYVCSCARGI